MGNSDSKQAFKHGSIAIQVDNQHVMIGQKITGRVICKLDQSYPSEKLVIEFTGKEKVIWEGSDSKQRDHKHSGHIVIKTTILQIPQVLQNFQGGQVPTGEHVFPFSFDLPMDLPPSFFFVGHNESEIQVTYKLTAGIQDTRDDKKAYKPLFAKRIMIISSPPKKVDFNICVQRDHQVSTMLVVNQGTSKVQFNLERNCFQPNEMMGIQAFIDNLNSDQALKLIKFKVFREIKATSANGSEFVDKTLLMKRKIDGVPAKKKEERNAQIALDQIIIIDKYVKEFIQKRPHISQEMGTWLNNMQPTLKTHNFSCDYLLEVKFQYSNILGKSIKPIVIPFQIYYHNNLVEDNSCKNQQPAHAYEPMEQIVPNPYAQFNQNSNGLMTSQSMKLVHQSSLHNPPPHVMGQPFQQPPMMAPPMQQPAQINPYQPVQTYPAVHQQQQPILAQGYPQQPMNQMQNPIPVIAQPQLDQPSYYPSLQPFQPSNFSYNYQQPQQQPQVNQQMNMQQNPSQFSYQYEEYNPSPQDYTQNAGHIEKKLA